MSSLVNVIVYQVKVIGADLVCRVHRLWSRPRFRSECGGGKPSSFYTGWKRLHGGLATATRGAATQQACNVRETGGAGPTSRDPSPAGLVLADLTLRVFLRRHSPLRGASERMASASSASVSVHPPDGSRPTT